MAQKVMKMKMGAYVHTPWYEESIPFVEAAEIGTEKVIKGPLKHRYLSNHRWLNR